MSERPLMAGDGLHPQRGNRLPLYCTGRKVTPKQGGLMKQFPLLAAEWDVEKNAPLTPQDVDDRQPQADLVEMPKGPFLPFRRENTGAGQWVSVLRGKERPARGNLPCG